MKKFVIWNDAWEPWASEFRQRLGPEWDVITGSGTDWLQANLSDADALLATELPLSAVPQQHRLRAWLYPGAGCSHIAAEQVPAGCVLTNVFEHESSMAEYVLMVMLVHTTGLLKHLQTFSRGEWAGSGRVGGEPHGELAGRTVGLFGYGHIGQAIARRAAAFDMKVSPVTRSHGDLTEVLRSSDYFVIAAPLTEQTRDRIGAQELAMLPRDAFLINVARAEIVSEAALYDALLHRRLGGAALDVWYEYPRQGERGHGSRFPFHRLPNVLCTPHYSAWTQPMILRRVQRMCGNLRRLAAGEPLHRVVLEGTWRP